MEFIQDSMHFLLICKFKKDEINSNRDKVETLIFETFKGTYINSARINKIHSKMKTLEWSQRFSHCKSIGNFPDDQGQLTQLSEVQSGRNVNSSQFLW